MTGRIRRRALWRVTRARWGISLIEVVVACTLLAVTLTALTGVAARLAARTHNIAAVEQRTAIYFQEVNRAESTPYDSLFTNRQLVTDSLKSGNNYFVWSYVVDSQPNVSPAAANSYFRRITLTVTPRMPGVSSVTGVIRRGITPSVNVLFKGP